MSHPEVEALSLELRAAYEAAWDEIVTEQEAIALDLRKSRRRARLQELREMVEERMGQLDVEAHAWVSQNMPTAYRIGADEAAHLVGAPFRWTNPDRVAINLIAQDTWDDLLASTQNVRASVKATVRRLARERALMGRIKGETALQSARRLERELRERGIYAVIYRDGSRHGLAEYTRTVLLTKSGQAANTGGLMMARQSGVQYVEVFDGTGDPICAPVANTIQTVEWSLANPLGHPRCQRAFGYRPEIKTPEDAAKAKASTTEAQRADQAASERAREQANRERTNRRARQRRAMAKAGRSNP